VLRLKPLFLKHLRSRGLPVTPQRMKVLEEVLRQGGHFGAEELTRAIQRRGGSVSRATVYRTLELLAECGIVRKLRLGEERFRYEVTSIEAHHDHLVCASCGRVIEFFEKGIEDLQDEICREANFTPFGHTLVIYGRCETCGKSTRAGRYVAEECRE